MEIQQLKDTDYLNDFEKKHLPAVKLPRKIKVGQKIKAKVEIGDEININIREKFYRAKIVERPFYSYAGKK